MATSGSADYSYNRNQIITAALRKLAVVAQGESPTSTQITEASEALNLMVKTFVTDGMPLWKVSEHSLTLLASTASYTIGSRLLKVVQAYRSTDSVDTPLRIITRDEYNRLSSKTSTGYPVSIYHDPRRADSIITVWPVPDSTVAGNTTVRLTYAAPFEDFDSSTDDPDFPQEWFEALVYGLADRLAPEYSIPLEDRKMLKQEAKEHKAIAESFGSEEGSLFFQVDWRGHYGSPS